MSHATTLRWARTRAEWRDNPRVVSAIEPRTRARSRVSEFALRLIAVILVAWLFGLLASFQAALVILNLTGIACSVAGLRWAPAGLLGIAMLVALEPITGPYLLRSGFWRWNTVNYWLLIVLVLSLPYFARLTDVHTRLLQWLVVILALGLLSVSDISRGVQYVFALLTVFSLLIYFHRIGDDRESWYWSAVVTATLTGVGFAVYLLRFEDLPRVNRNLWCLVPLTALFTICLAARFTRTLREQATLGLLATVNFTWVLLSAARGGTLVAIACLFFIVTAFPGRVRVAFVSVAALVATVLMYQFADMQAFAFDRMALLLDSSRSMAVRTSQRSELMATGFEVFQSSPIVGVGTAGFVEARQHVTGLEWRTDTDLVAHSGWIRILAENGIVGFLVLLAYVCSFAIVGWQRPRDRLFQLGLLTTVALSLSFVSYEFEFKAIWLIAAGTTVIFNHSRTRTGPHGSS